MKNFIQISSFFLFFLCFCSCKKESIATDNSPTSYLHSKKGEVKKNMKAGIYRIANNDFGTCEGYFLRPNTGENDYLIQISSGISDSILSLPDLGSHEFMVDIEYLGVAYNCTQSFKKPTNYSKSHPIEIQQVKITRIEKP
tara:strand:+ start:17007 stop:17429 length:423 start_codon:yes stop_codon:yes gene_type:complete